ncbi:hypothetical protein [Pedobacter agri]|uniref:hypothetical protein n=1 Tax=Pedobacter agri TaxID=454586 RepID=UPI00292FE16C|nr:hypothetical protein [Pedobacter agri]
MIDPKDEDQKNQADSQEQVKTSTQENGFNEKDSHWNSHQSIDEEGNELSADDVK